MASKSNRLGSLIFTLGLIVFPSVALSAGAETNSSASESVESDSSRYGKSSKGRFQEAKSLINQKKFIAAYSLLDSISMKSKDEADRQNLLGFTARKHGELDKAASHYKRALEIDPKHKGALEYQGELFLMLGQMGKALNNLKLLKSQCQLGCLELTQLKAAIDRF